MSHNNNYRYIIIILFCKVSEDRVRTCLTLHFPVPILAASDLIQALTLIIASFGLYPDFFITFEATGGE